jgi:outer membrane receptor protein involved in Fe transport
VYRLIARFFCISILAGQISGPGLPLLQANDADPAQTPSLQAVLEDLRLEGLELVYSTALVKENMRVEAVPENPDPLEKARQILAPFGLALQEADGIYLVVRSARKTPAQDSGTILIHVRNHEVLPDQTTMTIQASPELGVPERIARGLYQYRQVTSGSYRIRLEAEGYASLQREAQVVQGGTAIVSVDLIPGPGAMETINVSASRYVLYTPSQFYIDQRALQALPDLGDDPVRSAHRLPGVAASGLSSQPHFRGGEKNETAIYMNGLKLTDPFHIRDYHGIFSLIDARAISGVEAYTGGFPVQFGDQTSGILLLETQKAEGPGRTELGLSFYNTSFLNSGSNADKGINWLFTVRRSNLDILVKKDMGQPHFFDIFSELGFELSNTAHLSLNALYANDSVTVTTESDPEELEQSVSDTRNSHFWIRLENQWTPDLSSDTVFSFSYLDNDRNAEVNDPDQYIGAVHDRRKVKSYGLRQDWLYEGFDGHLLRWGFELRHQSAQYDYRSRAEYSEFFALYPGIDSPSESHVNAAPNGNVYGLFFADRMQLGENTALDLGLRLDRQTYTRPDFDLQISPRISLFTSVSPATELRMSWGRFYQSQSIQRLQVEDGLDHFFPPQRADHWIAGLRQQFGKQYRLRAEVYVKNYDRMKPRFENLFDPLGLIPELEPDRVRLDPRSAKARGAELTLEYRRDDDLDWWASYTWSRATDRIDSENQRRSWDQTHAFQAGFSWRPGPWEIGSAISLHSGWPTTGMTLGLDEEEDIYFPIPGPRNAEQLGTFATLDVRIARKFPVGNGQLSAFIEVTNLTDRKNECCIDYDIEEDQDEEIFLDVSVENWLPRIVALGILWEF